MSQEQPHFTTNREVWTLVNAQHTDDDARRPWAADQIRWGLFGIPQPELGILGDVSGLDVLELGCGSAYFSAWLMRAGAHPVAVDLTLLRDRLGRVGRSGAAEELWVAHLS